MLKVNGIDVFYGDLQVLWDVSFEVKEKEIVVLVGANGAGKSTTIRTVSSLLTPRKGASNSTGCGSIRLPPTHHRTRHRPCAGRQAALSSDERGGESDHGNASRGSQGQTFRDHGDASIAFSQAQGEAKTACRDPFRRRAADARRRQGADVPPKLMMFDEPSLGLAPILVQEIFQHGDAGSMRKGSRCFSWSRMSGRPWPCAIGPMCWKTAGWSWKAPGRS